MMNGREKFEAAFSAEGTPEFPAAICYHSIFLRDHWEEVTEQPWWRQYDPDPAAALPLIDQINKTGEDWFRLRFGQSRRQQRELVIEETSEGVFCVNRATGAREALHRPPVGGEQVAAKDELNPPARGVSDLDKLDAIIGSRLRGGDSGEPRFVDDGYLDLPRRLQERFGTERFAFMHVESPYWRCYRLWGFEGMMEGLFDFPDLIEHACRRFLADEIRLVERCGAAGAAGIWIEECMTAMVSPDQYRRFCLPYLRELIDAIRAAGMRSIYYYCGSPQSRWDLLLDSGADALSLEEGKKGFAIDIAEVCEEINGRITVLGNLDAIGVLEKGSDDALREEIIRQCRAGRRNGSRFIMSIGSPVTPGTPLGRVQRYCELVHEFGGT